VKQCSVLVVNCDHRKTAHREALERTGFRVVETREWPDDEMGARVRSGNSRAAPSRMETMGMLAARMRAKPRFTSPDAHRHQSGDPDRCGSPKRDRRGL
jgi:hypothetical protein